MPHDTIVMVMKTSINNGFFGIAFGSTMKNVDMIVATIIGTKIEVNDYYSTGNKQPDLDVKQDVTLLGYQIDSTSYTVKFSRLLNTGDQNDYIIKEG